MSHPELILIPGLGADRDLFFPQSQHFGERLRVVEDAADATLWLQRPSMEAAARAFLAHMADFIPQQHSYVLGGMSFGGSLAVEIARLIVREGRLPRPRAVALIASNRTSTTISRGFRVNRLLGSAVPRPMVRGSLRFLSGVFARREGLSAEDQRRLREMAQRANVSQLMWGAKAIASWSCTDSDLASLEIPILQAHGQRDWVIPIHDPHVTTPLPQGRHLITWTHRHEINTWLEDTVLSADSPRASLIG